MAVALSLQPKEGLGSSVAGGGDVWGLLSPMSLSPGLCWGVDGLATPSWLSQHLCPLGVTAREGRSGAHGPVDGVTLRDMEGVPYPLGSPSQPCCHRSWESSVPRLSPHRESPVQEGAHPMEEHVVPCTGT